MSRKFIAIAFAVLSISLAAQDGAAYVKNLVGNNRVSFSYMVYPKGQGAVHMDGKVVIDGDCYFLDSKELEIVCDGQTKWTIDKNAKEVYIDSSEGSREFMANPSEWIDQVKDLKINDKTITGTVDIDDKPMSFKFYSITSKPLSGSTDGFVFDVSMLNGDWVITDLR